LALLVVSLALLLAAQAPKDPIPDITDPRLPNGKSQREEILKADHQKSLEDAGKLMELTEELKIELEKNDRHVLAVGTLKKLDDIEKLTKRIRGRLKRY
jgi:cell division septation protein DedD